MRKINTKIILGDCREVLKGLDENSIDLIVTSPPYADSRNDTYGGIKPDGTFILNIKEGLDD
jgi:DNA modification methylase